jgi:hypothetical protein
MTVYKALEKIDQFKNDKRIMIEISERQPIIEPLPEDVDSAIISKACKDAKAKADKLAKATGVCVGSPLEIEEFKRGARGSGSYGDYDYGNYQGITIASAAAVSAGDISEEGRYRVKSRELNRLRLEKRIFQAYPAASCYSTFVLAESGLFDGCLATTTWWLCSAFETRYPKIRLNADQALMDADRIITAGYSDATSFRRLFTRLT